MFLLSFTLSVHSLSYNFVIILTSSEFILITLHQLVLPPTVPFLPMTPFHTPAIHQQCNTSTFLSSHTFETMSASTMITIYARNSFNRLQCTIPTCTDLILLKPYPLFETLSKIGKHRLHKILLRAYLFNWVGKVASKH